MPKYDVTIVVEITETNVEAANEEEAKVILEDDAKTRFPGNVTVTTHSCN